MIFFFEKYGKLSLNYLFYAFLFGALIFVALQLKYFIKID